MNNTDKIKEIAKNWGIKSHHSEWTDEETLEIFAQQINSLYPVEEGFRKVDASVRLPEKKGWYDTNKGDLFWNTLSWYYSSKDKSSKESIKYWYEPTTLYQQEVSADEIKTISEVVMENLEETKVIIDIKHNLIDALEERERQLFASSPTASIESKEVSAEEDMRTHITKVYRRIINREKLHDSDEYFIDLLINVFNQVPSHQRATASIESEQGKEDEYFCNQGIDPDNCAARRDYMDSCSTCHSWIKPSKGAKEWLKKNHKDMYDAFYAEDSIYIPEGLFYELLNKFAASIESEQRKKSNK